MFLNTESNNGTVMVRNKILFDKLLFCIIYLNYYSKKYSDSSLKMKTCEKMLMLFSQISWFVNNWVIFTNLQLLRVVTWLKNRILSFNFELLANNMTSNFAYVREHWKNIIFKSIFLTWYNNRCQNIVIHFLSIQYYTDYTRSF